jgi:hypothetical protein
MLGWLGDLTDVALGARLVSRRGSDSWLATEPQITALAIVRRLAAIDPATFGDKQHSIVQRLLRCGM